MNFWIKSTIFSCEISFYYGLFYFVFSLQALKTAAEEDYFLEEELYRLRESVQKFDAQLYKTFQKYSQSDILEKETQVDGLFEVHNSQQFDFVETTELAYRRIQQFFDLKISALRKVIRTAEEVTAKTGDDNNYKYYRGVEEDCTKFTRKFNLANAHNEAVWKKLDTLSIKKTAVHLALDSYKCDSMVVRDFNWTGDRRIEHVMESNMASDPTIQRQYIGTYSGLTRIFPGFEWDVAPKEYSIDLFDPRNRPWFVGAESGPRNILFLIDYSGSVKGLNLHLIKMTVMWILNTLTSNDFFSGIWYNSRRGFIFDHCNFIKSVFVPATTRNKLAFRRCLDKIEDRDQAHFAPALEMAFAQFFPNQHQNQTFNKKINTFGEQISGHKMILLFTDGITDAVWPVDLIERYQREHPDDPIRVFGYSIGHGRGKQSVLEWYTCKTKAGPTQTVINNMGDVRLKSRDYLRKLIEILALSYREKSEDRRWERPVIWSHAYMDAQKMGPVISLSLPILGPKPEAYKNKQQDVDGNNGIIWENGTHQFLIPNQPANKNLDGFWGIGALDIAFEELQRQLDLTNGEENHLGMFYGFIVDDNGIVYFHPKMKTPRNGIFGIRQTLCHKMITTSSRGSSGSRIPYSKADEYVQKQMGYIDSISQISLLELEGNPSETMKEFFETILKRNCHSLLEDFRHQYRCMEVKGTPFILGFVLSKNMRNVKLKRRGRFVPQLQDFIKWKKEFREFNEPGRIQKDLNKNSNTENLTNQPLFSESTNDTVAKNEIISTTRPAAVIGYVLQDNQEVQQFPCSEIIRMASPSERFFQLFNILTDSRYSCQVSNEWKNRLAYIAFEPLKKWSMNWNSPPGNEVVRDFSPNVPFSLSCAGLNHTLPMDFDTQYYVNSFMQISSEALYGFPGINAFYPKCEVPSLKEYFENSVLFKKEHDCVSETRIQVDANLEKKVLTFTKPMCSDNFEWARIGTQLHISFLHEKFHEDVSLDPDSGWISCQRPNVHCFLMTSSAYIVGTVSADLSQHETRLQQPTHLSDKDPFLFQQLLDLGHLKIKKRMVYNSRCPAILSDSKHLKTHPSGSIITSSNSHLLQSLGFTSSASSTTTKALGSDVLGLLKLIFGKIAYLAPSILWCQLTNFINDVITTNERDKCDVENQPDLTEQCLMEYTNYFVDFEGNSSELPRTMEEFGIRMLLSNFSDDGRGDCERQLTIVPFEKTDIYLLVLDSEDCARKQIIDRIQTPRDNVFLPQKQLPYCNLTTDYINMHRRRTDLDYTVIHENESNPICISSSAISIQFKMISICFHCLLFIIFTSYNTNTT